MEWDLPKGRRCDCRKSGTSYPHWPPTCQTEALDQLNCLGSHTLTDYILYTLLDGFPLGKDHTVNVDGTALNDDILGAE
jgi:hypothetical protein